MKYQLNFFDRSRKGHRKDCMERLALVREHALGGGSLLDMGCDRGLFSFGLADMYSKVLGVDNCTETQQECNHLRDLHQQDFGHVTFVQQSVSEMTVSLKPDEHTTILYMSVHHHVIAQVGWKQANEHLRKLAEGCTQMFFDMGQKDERCPQHSWHRLLPEMPDPHAWLEDYIRHYTRFTGVHLIGSSPIHGIRRLLWKLEL